MHSRVERLARPVILLMVVAGLVAIPGAARAETTQSDLVLIRAEDVVAEDLFAAGNTIQVSGTIQGDLIASSMGELRIDGTVEGDVIGVASRVVVAGVVEGSVRVAAPEVIVEGTVKEDVAVVAGTLAVTSSGHVGRDLLFTVWSTDMAGDVVRNVTGLGRTLALAGVVNGNVDADVHRLSVDGSARIDGDLRYRSDEEASVAPAASISGSILDRRPLSPNVSVVGLEILIKLLIVTFGAAMGLVTVWAAGTRTIGAGRVLTDRPIAAVGQGLGVVAVPIVLLGGVVAAVAYLPGESVFPLLLAAIPFLLAVLGALALFALITPVPPSMALGRRMAPKRSAYGQFLIGFLVIAVASLIPVIGRIVVAAVLVLGIGGWITRSNRSADEAPAEASVVGRDAPIEP